MSDLRCCLESLECAALKKTLEFPTLTRSEYLAKHPLEDTGPDPSGETVLGRGSPLLDRVAKANALCSNWKPLKHFALFGLVCRNELKEIWNGLRATMNTSGFAELNLTTYVQGETDSYSTLSYSVPLHLRFPNARFYPLCVMSSLFVFSMSMCG